MLETEMDNHLGYDRYERCGEPNYHNGTKPKTVRSKYGEFYRPGTAGAESKGAHVEGQGFFADACRNALQIRGHGI